MNIREPGSVDECERLLRSQLQSSTDLSVHDTENINHALKWYRGETDEELSLIQWMAISRIVGENIAIRLDTGAEYHYLRFDEERHRVVIIDPQDNSQVPIEQTDITPIFESASVTPVIARSIKPKTYGVITVVSSDTHDSKLLLGKYPDPLTRYSDTGETIEYKPQLFFTLPEPMTSEEIQDWLDSEESNPIQDVALENAERGWGEQNQPSEESESSVSELK